LAADWPNPSGTICAFLYLGKAYPLVRGPDDKGWRRAQPLAVTPHRFGRLVFDLEPLADGEGPLHLVVAIEFPGRWRVRRRRRRERERDPDPGSQGQV